MQYLKPSFLKKGYALAGVMFLVLIVGILVSVFHQVFYSEAFSIHALGKRSVLQESRETAREFLAAYLSKGAQLSLTDSVEFLPGTNHGFVLKNVSRGVQEAYQVRHLTKVPRGKVVIDTFSRLSVFDTLPDVVLFEKLADLQVLGSAMISGSIGFWSGNVQFDHLLNDAIVRDSIAGFWNAFPFAYNSLSAQCQFFEHRLELDSSLYSATVQETLAADSIINAKDVFLNDGTQLNQTVIIASKVEITGSYDLKNVFVYANIIKIEGEGVISGQLIASDSLIWDNETTQTNLTLVLHAKNHNSTGGRLQLNGIQGAVDVLHMAPVVSSSDMTPNVMLDENVAIRGYLLSNGWVKLDGVHQGPVIVRSTVEHQQGDWKKAKLNDVVIESDSLRGVVLPFLFSGNQGWTLKRKGEL